MSEFIIECEYDFDEGWIPGEQHEEIVRCRDCKHYSNQELDGETGTCDLGLEGLDLLSIVEPDGFCAWGERKWVE